MKISGYILVALMLASGTALAQTPTPEMDTTKTPIKQTDPPLKVQPSNDYLENHLRIMPEELPEPVKRTLESGTQYSGWERAVIFRKEDGKEFVVEITEGNKTESFRFDRQGKPLPLDE